MVIARAVKNVYVVAAKRTPFGTYGGKLTPFSAIDLQEIASRAALDDGKVPKEAVDSIIVGNVMHASKDSPYLPRHTGLRIGLNIHTPALSVNRLCGSGFQSLVSGCQEINCGDSNIVMTGGAENMSAMPYALYGVRFGTKLGTDLTLVDSMWQGLIDQHIKTPMGITAENLADQYKISREEADAFALRSQKRWKDANDAGRFTAEMAAVTVKTKKGPQEMNVDEHPKPSTTPEIMAKLPAVFKKGGTVNAANASGISDGAACVIIANEEAIKEHNLKPLAKVIGYGIAGCDPNVMGIGPVPAIRALLQKTKLELKDIDMVEVNEAFASQYLACEKELGLDPEKTNVNGGAIALGHPVGASGSRIVAHLSHELRRTGNKYAIGSACIGGGQGIAVLLENI